jgi:Arc/MetJ-type ribon-helix-helix transcriptional regulator
VALLFRLALSDEVELRVNLRGPPAFQPRGRGDDCQFPRERYIWRMAETLNISLAPGQGAWLKARQEEEGFASASDVVRDLIRRQQEKERADLQAEFETVATRAFSSPSP